MHHTPRTPHSENHGFWLGQAGRDHTARVWDMATRRAVLTYHGHDAALSVVAFSRVRRGRPCVGRCHWTADAHAARPRGRCVRPGLRPRRPAAGVLRLQPRPESWRRTEGLGPDRRPGVPFPPGPFRSPGCFPAYAERSFFLLAS